MASIGELAPAGAAAIGAAEELEIDSHGLPIIPTKPLGPPVIELSGISKDYDLASGEKVKALREISLRLPSASVPAGANIHDSVAAYPVRQGEFLIIRGPSGGGKTTLLNIIGCIDQASAGVFSLFGERIDHTKVTDEELSAMRLERIGFTFQSFNLLATLSALENVELPMAMLGKLSPDQRRLRARALLKMVGLEDRQGHLPSEMSGGEQ